jgi:hypothetical protein
MAIVTAFSQRKALVEDDELNKEFYQSSIIHTKMVNNFTSKDSNPRNPNFGENLDISAESQLSSL